MCNRHHQIPAVRISFITLISIALYMRLVRDKYFVISQSASSSFSLFASATATSPETVEALLLEDRPLAITTTIVNSSSITTVSSTNNNFGKGVNSSSRGSSGTGLAGGYDHEIYAALDSGHYTVAKESDLTLMISITSGPNHRALRTAIRKSWARPCLVSSTCDYRFFVDRVDYNLTDALKSESAMHPDMVFRGNWCPFMMNRHHEDINYGNSPLNDNFTLPRYSTRAMYKIDWKVCFLKWATQNNKMAHYHVFVEDDSFVCTENVIFQTVLLREYTTSIRASTLLSASEKAKLLIPFRSGHPMYDGFDDSSTIMSREIAQVFADHYPDHPGFNCTEIADHMEDKQKMWLSWGNSWMERYCGWRKKLLSVFNLTIHVPKLVTTMFNCSSAELPPVPPPSMHLESMRRRREKIRERGRRLGEEEEEEQEEQEEGREEGMVAGTTEVRGEDTDSRELQGIVSVTDRLPNATHVKPPPPAVVSDGHIEVQCGGVAFVLHTHNAATVTKHANAQHMCEYTLFIDKVKNPLTILHLWEGITANSYHNFTSIFLSDGLEGWRPLLQRLKDQQDECLQRPHDQACVAWRKERRRTVRRVLKEAGFGGSPFESSSSFLSPPLKGNDEEEREGGGTLTDPSVSDFYGDLMKSLLIV